jgi:hypothetical protein
MSTYRAMKIQELTDRFTNVETNCGFAGVCKTILSSPCDPAILQMSAKRQWIGQIQNG